MAGFHHVLLAEWTKLRSVPRWVLTMVAAIVLTVLIALLAAPSSHTERADDGPGGEPGDNQPIRPPEFMDGGHFVHTPLSGDGSIAARVVTQDNSHEWAKAGVLVRESTTPGSQYAAMMVTPRHGVRLQSNFTTDIAGVGQTAPRWLRLTRAGNSVTGYESPDGTDWSRVGTVDLALPHTVEVGMFVASADRLEIQRQFGGESISGSPTVGTATFDSVRVEPGQQAPWRDHDRSLLPGDGGSTEVDGTFTVSGSGDIARFQFGDDITRDTLTGVLIGLMAIVALGVLFITSEYRRGMIRTTFTASPRRGRVLAAKAIVIGTATFVAGLVASLTAFLLATPIMRANGFAMPSLFDGPVLRAVVGTAALLAVVAVLSLAVGSILRHSATAITIVIVALLVPEIVATGLPLSVAVWLGRVTPSAGFAIQQTVERYDSAIDPLAGFGVLCAYAAVTLSVAFWLQRRRDA